MSPVRIRLTALAAALALMIPATPAPVMAADPVPQAVEQAADSTPAPAPDDDALAPASDDLDPSPSVGGPKWAGDPTGDGDLTGQGVAAAEGYRTDGGNPTASSARYAPGVVLVAYRDGTQPGTRTKTRASVHAKRATSVSPRAKLTERLELARGQSVEAAIAKLERDPAVRFAEPDYLVRTSAVPDDPLWLNSSLWDMASRTSSPSNQFGTGAVDAWAAGATGSRDVVVGIIDGGIQVDHPDLAPNIWTNPWEIPGNGIDDDGNGYVDDIHGWDFMHNDATVDDGPNSSSHGTHVAGTIGGVGGNGIGISGVNWAVTMISAKFLEGSGWTSDAVRALDYLTDLKVRHGLNIVATNNSWGGPGRSELLEDAIRRAGDQGIMFIAAAGNDYANTDAAPFYPASSTCTTRADTGAARGWDCIVSVAAIDRFGSLADFSNRGAVSVDLGAPGVDVTSTIPGSDYWQMSGTSMAAPHVTGAVALLAACAPGLAARQLHDDLLGSTTPTTSLAGLTLTGGRLSVGDLAAQCDASAPPSALLISPPAWVTGSSFEARAWFSRAVTGLTTDDFTMAGTSTGWSVTAVSGSGMGPYQVTASATAPPDGTVIVTLQANSVTDGTRSGPVAPVAAPAAWIDRTAPAIGTVSATPGAVTRAGAVAISAAANDPTGVANADVRIDAGPWQGAATREGSFGQPSESLSATVGGSVVQVAPGTDFTCVLMSSGRVRCAGDNSREQMGPNWPAPRAATFHEIADLGDIVSISAGYRHVCAVRADGAVYCWGNNLYGEVGNGSIDWSVPTPTRVGGITNAVAVSAGLNHTCALLAGGSMRCWGKNRMVLGDGTVSDRTTPVDVVGIEDAISMSIGNTVACAVLRDATVRCWGGGRHAELGNGTLGASAAPRQVLGISNAISVSVAVGSVFACALLADGTVRCWGTGDDVFQGFAGSHSEPVTIAGISTATEIATGFDFVCARLADGTVRCWGRGYVGQLGNGTTNGSWTPVAVSGASGATSIGANGGHACAVDGAGAVSCWGNNFLGQLGDDRGTERLVAGPVTGLSGPLAAGPHTACLRATDRPGNMSTGAACATFSVAADGTAPVASFGSPTSPNHAADITWGLGFSERISGLAARDLSVAGTATGCTVSVSPGSGPVAQARVSGCSSGTVGLVLAAGSVVDDAGNPSAAAKASPIVTIDRTPPTAVGPVLTPASTEVGRWVAVHSSATDPSTVSAGEVRVDSAPWTSMAPGDGAFGGTTEALTASVNVVSGARDVVSGGGFSCALLEDGTVRCWGENGLGQLGDGTTTNRPRPVVVSGLPPAIALSAGAQHACAIVAGGVVWCWGEGSLGRLGHAADPGPSGPMPVSSVSDAVEVSAGRTHTCVVLADGGLQCWGDNYYGQLGTGWRSDHELPVPVTGLGPATHVAVGYSHACAVLADGTVRCWGYGVLGDGQSGAPEPTPTPVVVSGISGATAISAGHLSTCVLVGDGAVRCWGVNDFHEMGDGTTTQASTPVAVAGITDATALATGGWFACVLVSGAVECWGYNADGELGDGTTAEGISPVQAAGISDAVAISASDRVDDNGYPTFHACAVLGDRSVSCWGAGGAGELGDGGTPQRATPGAVASFTAPLAFGDHQVCVRASDPAGNTGDGPTCATLTVAPDTTPPSATVEAPGAVTRATTVLFNVLFNEPVTGLAAADLSLAGTATGCAVSSIQGGPASYTAAVGGCGEGTVALRIAAGAVVDGAGNTGPAGQITSSTVRVDRTTAAATIGGQATPTRAAALSYTVTFSEPVTGLAADDFTRSGTATGCTVATPTGSGATYAVSVTGCGNGTVVVALKAGSVVDAAGSASPASAVSAPSVTVDRIAPTVASVAIRPRLGSVASNSSAGYELTWTSTDVGVGVSRYEIARSVDRAAYLSLAAGVTAKTYRVALTSGKRYRFRVRAIDLAGNTGGWAYSLAVMAGLVQQTNSSLHWSSGWTTSRSASFLGGSARYATRSGASVTYTFSGRSVALISTRAKSRGKVRVYIDGTYVRRLDLWAATTTFRSLVFARVWASSGTHTIRLVVEGTSIRPRVDVDAFAVLR